MNSDKMIYWVALGVFAMGISHEYRDGKFPTAHRAVATAETALCRLASRAEQTVAMAKFIVNPPAAAPEDVVAVTGDFGQEQVELLRDQARDQPELLREQVQAQAEIFRARAEMRRAQIEQMRQLTNSQFHFSQTADRRVMLVCPKTGARVSVRVNPPDVEVSNNF
jgi:hypothetical protein